MTPRLLLTIALLAAGCSTGRSPQPAQSTRNGTLRVAMLTEPRTLNPDISGDETAYVIAASLFNRLVAVDLDGRLLPDLAERWEIGPHETTYTFWLREGVSWHDGRPFSAADVKWTLEALRDARGAVRQLAARIDRIEIVDPHTLRLRLNEPWAPFLVTLGQYDAAILPRHRYTAGDWKTDAESLHPIGTGPFKFAEWRRGERLTLVANGRYFKPGPLLERVEYLFEPDAARANALLLGERADLLIGRPSASSLGELAAAEHLSVVRTPSDGRYYGLFNLTSEPFANREARLAAHQATDRRALVRRALGGLGAPAVGFYTPSVRWAYNEDARVPEYDQEHARSVFRHIDRRGRGAVVVAANVPPFRSIGIEIVEQWREAGLDARVRLVDPADFVAVMSNPGTEWDIVVLGGGNGPDPDVLRLRFASDGIFSFSGFRSRRFDDAVRKGGRQSAVPVRAAAYREAQDVLAEDLPILPLAEGLRVTVRSRRVYGLPQAEARGLVSDYDFSLVKLQ